MPARNSKQPTIDAAVDFAEVLEAAGTGHKFLVSKISLEPGDVLCRFSASAVFTEPHRLTIQLDHNKHITLLPECLQFTNHSCEPNIFFDTSRMKVVCLEKVRPGDDLTFFYPSTELEMAEPFLCHCGADGCLGEIRGAAHLDPRVLQGYRLTRFIREALAAQGRDARADAGLCAPEGPLLA